MAGHFAGSFSPARAKRHSRSGQSRFGNGVKRLVHSPPSTCASRRHPRRLRPFACKSAPQCQQNGAEDDNNKQRHLDGVSGDP
jgi:hypothetical protein